jgi:hypothetical protein
MKDMMAEYPWGSPHIFEESGPPKEEKKTDWIIRWGFMAAS